jgi:hypothetical protein
MDARYAKISSVDGGETHVDIQVPASFSRIRMKGSHLACQRLKEAVTEIKKDHPVTAYDSSQSNCWSVAATPRLRACSYNSRILFTAKSKGDLVAVRRERGLPFS